MGSWKPVVATLDHDTIVAAYKSGAAVTDLAKQHNTKNYHIRSVLKQAGLKIIKGRFKSSYNPHNKSNVDEIEIIRLVKSGVTFSETANRLQCSINVVRQRCYSAGIKSPGFCFDEATNLSTQIGFYAYEKLSDGAWLFNKYVIERKPSRIIASELGCGKKAVLSALRRHRITVRKGPGNRGQFRSEFGKCNDFWCDSYWEWKISNRLDRDDRVLKFIKNPFPILYRLDGKNKKYIPDFLVILNGSQFLLEVKPDGLLPYVEAKIKAAKNSSFNFYVINVDDEFPWFV